MRLQIITILMGLLWSWQALAQCNATPSRSAGGNYKPITVQKVDIGSGLVVSGRILRAGDCQPISNARIEHWQANSAGVYVDALRAYLLSDAQGGYRFETEWPAIRPPHIHFIVKADGYRSLTTQWVADEPVKTIRFDMILEPVSSR